MLRRLLPVLFVISALLLFACRDKAVAPPTNDSGPETAKKAPAATPATTATTASTDKIGVPECDNYLAKVDACISGKVPEAARAQFKAAMDANRKAWQQAASTPQGKAGLAAACKQATETAKTTYKTYNCTF
jgi:hypothetical protein